MPRVEERVGGNINRKIVNVHLVKRVGEAVAAQALADHEAIGFENREFVSVKTKIRKTLIICVRLIVNGGISVEVFKESRCRGIERNASAIFIGRRIHLHERFQRQLAELLEFAAEFGGVTVDAVCIISLRGGWSYLRANAVEAIGRRRRDRLANEFIPDTDSPKNRIAERLPCG